jgi:Amt family ammonium transporter
VLGVLVLDRLQIDDPVGAFPVHGLNGVWGTLAVGIFGQKAGLAQFGIQILGIAVAVVFVAVTMTAVFKLIDLTIGLRVTREEELRGLDIGEHGLEAYSGFQIFTTQ